MNNRDKHLLIFMKNPRRGRVKTRLARDIGNDRSLIVYEFMLRKIIESFAHYDEWKVMIYTDCVIPDNIQRDLGLTGINTEIQQGGTLGEKMLNAFSRAFDKGAESVVIIGTDCITITNDMIRKAFKSLNSTSSDIVIGPSLDGGYYLLGLNRLISTIFSDIEWSTDRVYSQTLKKAEELGYSHITLDYLNDIDTVYDINIGFINALKDHNRDFKIV